MRHSCQSTSVCYRRYWCIFLLFFGWQCFDHCFKVPTWQRLCCLYWKKSVLGRYLGNVQNTPHPPRGKCVSVMEYWGGGNENDFCRANWCILWGDSKFCLPFYILHVVWLQWWNCSCKLARSLPINQSANLEKEKKWSCWFLFKFHYLWSGLLCVISTEYYLPTYLLYRLLIGEQIWVFSCLEFLFFNSSKAQKPWRFQGCLQTYSPEVSSLARILGGPKSRMFSCCLGRFLRFLDRLLLPPNRPASLAYISACLVYRIQCLL